MIKYVTVVLILTLGVSRGSHAQDLSPYSACTDAPKTQAFETTKTVCSQAVKKANGQRTHAIEVADEGLDGKKLLAAARHNMVTGALLAKLADIHHSSAGTGLLGYSEETCKFTYQAKDVFNEAIAKPKPEDPIRVWYQKTETHMLGCAAVAFPKAQAYLETGQRDKIADVLRPLAYLGNEQARKTLGLMNIQSYGPAPSTDIPKPAFSTETAMEQFQKCQTPDMKALEASLRACETAHSQFRSFAIQANMQSEPVQLSEDFFFKSGTAAYQAFRISGAKDREDFKTACNYVGQAMAQFRNVKSQLNPQSQPAMIMRDTQRAAKICAQKGFR